jgi:DNA-binding transcriptional MerR regulator
MPSWESQGVLARSTLPLEGRVETVYMLGSLTIGDFSRVTFLSVKTLRHYHQAGLLEPAEVDPVTGYRRYTSAQIPIAQVIRRFRELDMPLDDIGRVLRAPDPTTRSQLIAAHSPAWRRLWPRPSAPWPPCATSSNTRRCPP